MLEAINLQDQILDECIKERKSVTVFFVNGFQMVGCVIAHDPSVVVLVSEVKQMMIYKHAISTIVPSRRLNCLDGVRE